MAEWAVRYRSASVALACRAFSISQTCYRYQPKLSDENELIADWLVTLTDAKKTWGLPTFETPSENIQCDVGEGETSSDLRCTIGVGNVTCVPGSKVWEVKINVVEIASHCFDTVPKNGITG